MKPGCAPWQISCLYGKDMTMATSVAPLNALAGWKPLEAHYPIVLELHLRKLFAATPKRGDRMTAQAVDIYFDNSKYRITDETLRLLL